MEIYLEDIGKVKQARIKINGITVIAGENATGKSTIGKALFSMFNGFYHLEEKIHRDKKENLARLLYRNFVNKGVQSNSKKKYFEQMADTLLKFFTEKNILSNETEEIKKFFQDKYADLFSTEEVENFVSDVLELMKIPSAEIRKSILSQTLNTEIFFRETHFHSMNHQEWLIWNLQNDLKFPYLDKIIEQRAENFVTNDIADKCEYYLSELVGDRAEIKNVTGDTELIYKKLWIPLQKLENEVFADD